MVKVAKERQEKQQAHDKTPLWLWDGRWKRMKDLLPGREGTVGVTAKDNRLFVEAVLYCYRAGIPWRDFPKRFGDFRIVDTRFTHEADYIREVQLHLQDYLSSQGRSFEYVRNGQSFPWKSGERLVLPIHEIRCRISSGSLRCLKVFLNERTVDSFVFRRDSRNGAPITRDQKAEFLFWLQKSYCCISLGVLVMLKSS